MSVLSASALLRHCGHPREIKRREEGPEHDRVACAKKRKRDGSQPGCATCGRHSPTCEATGVCVICSAPRGDVFHKAIEDWYEFGLAFVMDTVTDEMVRGWLELLAMQWSPPPGAQFEVAMGLSVDGGYVPVVEPEPHVYVPDVKPGQPVPTLLTAGRADVVWLEEINGLRIAMTRDWKSGSYPVAHPMENLQLHALGFAAAGMLGADAYATQIYYTRDGVLDMMGAVLLDSEAAADAWMAVEFAAMLDDKPRPGDWCGDCWERRMRRCSFAKQPKKNGETNGKR